MKRTLLNTTLYLVAFVAIKVLITLVIGAIAPIFGQKSDSGLMLVISSATAGLCSSAPRSLQRKQNMSEAVPGPH